MENLTLLKVHPKSQSTHLKEWVPLGLTKRNESTERLLPSKISLFSEQPVYFITWSLWGPQYHAVTVESMDRYPKVLLSGMGKVLVQEKPLTQLADCQLPTTISSFIVWSTEALEDTYSSNYYCTFTVISCTVISKMEVHIWEVLQNWGEGIARFIFSQSVHAFAEMVNKRITVSLLNRCLVYKSFTCPSCARKPLVNNKSESCSWWHLKCYFIPRKQWLTEIIFTCFIFVCMCMSVCLPQAGTRNTEIRKWGIPNICQRTNHFGETEGDWEILWQLAKGIKKKKALEHWLKPR